MTTRQCNLSAAAPPCETLQQSSNQQTNDQTERKRRVDARCRAANARCYSTLSRIVPSKEKRSIPAKEKEAKKKRASKAQILKETESHINYLESLISNHLQEKATRTRVKNVESWCENQWAQICTTFEAKHKAYCEATGRRSKACKKASKQMKNVKEHRDSGKVFNSWPIDEQAIGDGNVAFVTEISTFEHDAYESSVAGSEHGFTPVKLSSTWCLTSGTPTLSQSSGTHPITGCQTEAVVYTTDEESVNNGMLLCSESMWMSDDEEQNGMSLSEDQSWSELAPQRKKRAYRSRKRSSDAGAFLAVGTRKLNKVKASQPTREYPARCRRALNFVQEESVDDMVCDEGYSSTQPSTSTDHTPDKFSDSQTFSPTDETSNDSTVLQPCISLSQTDDEEAAFWRFSHDVDHCSQILEDEPRDVAVGFRRMLSCRAPFGVGLGISAPSRDVLWAPAFVDSDAEELAASSQALTGAMMFCVYDDESKPGGIFDTPRKRTTFSGLHSPLFGREHSCMLHA